MAGKGCEQAHRGFAAGAEPGWFGGLIGLGLSPLIMDHQGHAGEEPDPFAVLLCGRMAKPVVAHGMHSGREDVAQVTADELDAIEGEEFFTPAAGPIFPAEGDMGVIDFYDAALADGGSCDVGSQVFDGGGPGTDGLDVNTPFFAPNRRIHLPLVSVEFPAHGRFE